MELYEEMNEKIADIIAIGNDPSSLYASAYIKALRVENERLKAEIRQHDIREEKFAKEEGFTPDCSPYYIALEYKKACNRLAELEDKLESGQLVELPCKVGDKIYFVRVTHEPHIVKTFVDEVVISRDYFWVRCAETSRYLRFDRNGKLIENHWNVYLTKPQAEARLKELQEK